MPVASPELLKGVPDSLVGIVIVIDVDVGTEVAINFLSSKEASLKVDPIVVTPLTPSNNIMGRVSFSNTRFEIVYGSKSFGCCVGGIVVVLEEVVFVDAADATVVIVGGVVVIRFSCSVDNDDDEKEYNGLVQLLE